MLSNQLTHEEKNNLNSSLLPRSLRQIFSNNTLEKADTEILEKKTPKSDNVHLNFCTPGKLHVPT